MSDHSRTRSSIGYFTTDSGKILPYTIICDADGWNRNQVQFYWNGDNDCKEWLLETVENPMNELIILNVTDNYVEVINKYFFNVLMKKVNI